MAALSVNGLRAVVSAARPVVPAEQDTAKLNGTHPQPRKDHITLAH